MEEQALRGRPRALGAILAAGLLTGGATGAAALSPVESAALSGSPRLLVFALAQEARTRPSSPEARAAARLARSLGLAHPAGAGPTLIGRRVIAAPILEWDPNVNGGTPGGAFTVGPFEFTVDEASEAQAGVMVGATLGATAAFSVGRGHVLRFAASAAVRQAPEQDATKVNLSLSACGSVFTGGWSWVDGCLGAASARTELSDETERSLSVARVTVFPSGVGLHEARVGLRAVQGEDFVKPSLTLGLVTAAGFGALSLSGEVGREVEGRNTTLVRAGVALTRPVRGAATTVQAGYRRTGGSSFFGTERTDEIWSVGLSREVARGVQASLSVERTLSTVDLFDGTSVFVGFELGRLRF